VGLVTLMQLHSYDSLSICWGMIFTPDPYRSSIRRRSEYTRSCLSSTLCR
jgi:hypothetical protein